MDESTHNSGDSELDSVAQAIMAMDAGEEGSGADELQDASGVKENEPADNSPPADDGDSSGESEQAPADEAEPDEKADGEEEQEPPVASLEDLVAALGVDASAVMRLKAKTKIDGEDGEVTLADLVKSYQIEGHLSRKGQKLAEERSTFERSRQEAEAGIKQRTEQLDIQLALAQKRLLGQYASIDWDTLRMQNPSLYQQRYIEYQQLYGELSQSAQQLASERQREREAIASQHREYLSEQKRLLHNAVPEWNDRKVRDAELNDIRDYMKSRNIDPAQLETLQHHGYALALRDAKNWAKLQQESKNVRKKVGVAPPIVRPGVRKSEGQLSREKLKGLRDRVRSTGSVNDVAAFIMATS